VTRLCADDNDKKARDWVKEQMLALGAEYKVGMIEGLCKDEV
jgi:N-carbamoyl-L-amino-acid hydrolase